MTKKDAIKNQDRIRSNLKLKKSITPGFARFETKLLDNFELMLKGKLDKESEKDLLNRLDLL